MDIKKFVIYIFLSLLGVLFLIPFIWLINEAFSPLNDIGLKFPSYYTLVPFYNVMTNKIFVNSIYEGLIQSFGATFLSVLFSVGPAYIFSRKRFRFRIPLLLGILLLTGFPVFSLLIPEYVFYVKTSLYNNLIGVILFLGVLNVPIDIWILKNSFDQIPSAIENASYIDGASSFKSMLYIFLPLATPVLAVLIILDFVINWGNFYVPYILLSSARLFPVSVEIYSFFGAYNVKYNELAAFSIIYTVPAVILYIFAQKYMIKALSGGIKG
ncbi:ABC transport system permease protein P1P2A [Thermoplasma volcanium GSS1]|uniref:ABC transport system permease protein P1P2A n=1 Tax=Thermoplasma volcanium (strain ATCC 51530 / DSM 4299 / JCM 9571 / NBRC 15438 / GSS1) TaxID=273116 RepID=Q97C97_THEVO|nr:carbohydrate ABC transporter permease [Thermoplasma volcanium]BAB59348.1 ABC transport system permease protein P1P2A [Thermoplasma volcanium GSS1]